MISSKERVQFLKVYKEAFEDKSMTELYAAHIGDFALLFDKEEVTKSLLPLFFKLSQ